MATQFPISNFDTAAVPHASALRQLSFSAPREDGGVDLWSPPAISADWEAQCLAGRRMGVEAFEYISEHRDVTLLGAVVQGIARRGKFDGIEAGFFTALSTLLMR